ncbi:MAG: hypothetical protein Q9167_004960 [Letrouitia subvulpina]
MEGGDQPRRQYEQPNYSSQYGSSLRSNAPPPGVSERFRQSQLVAGRTQTSTPLRAPGENPQELVNFAYEQTQQYPPSQPQGVALQYQTDYTQDSQRAQQYATYPTQMMYNVPQQQQQIQSPYEAAPHNQQRQSTAVEALSTQFGVPPFYHASESTGASGPASASQQYTLAHFQQPMPYQNPGSVGRITLPSSFPTASAEYQSATADVAEQQEQDSSTFDMAYNQYQEALKQTFEYSSKGRLPEAGQSLLEITEWLLGHASELGNSPSSAAIQFWSAFVD